MQLLLVTLGFVAVRVRDTVLAQMTSAVAVGCRIHQCWPAGMHKANDHERDNTHHSRQATAAMLVRSNHTCASKIGHTHDKSLKPAGCNEQTLASA